MDGYLPSQGDIKSRVFTIIMLGTMISNLLIISQPSPAQQPQRPKRLLSQLAKARILYSR